MPVDKNIWSLAEAYANGTLDIGEQTALKERLSHDQQFANEFHECVNMLRALDGNGRQKRFKSALQEVSKQQKQPTADATTKRKTISLKTHYMRTAAIAAGIAVVTSISTFWAIQHNNKKIASQYSLLKRDLEKYKRSQNQIINTIKDTKTTAPQAQAKYSGTGFAISNDGYLVTNYHVTEGADSIYIQHNDGKYYKAHIVSFDVLTDLALLKVEEKDFRFSKSSVPYVFAPAKKNLGTHVFSLGFPQEEIVYNEGYISSNNGYSGDSSQYRLEITASPGQSGAPVLDGRGNVVGIITGKETASEGITYAISSVTLLKLLNNLPKDTEITLPKSNRLVRLSRERQIEKLEEYTCSIKVYKR